MVVRTRRPITFEAAHPEQQISDRLKDHKHLEN
jgi:hypothetical protein